MHELTIRLDDLGDIARVELPDPRSEQTVRDLLRRAGAATVRIEPFEEDDTAGHGASAALEVVVRIEDDTEGHAMSLRFPTAGEARDFQRRLLATGVIAATIVTGAAAIQMTGQGTAQQAGAPAAGPAITRPAPAMAPGMAGEVKGGEVVAPAVTTPTFDRGAAAKQGPTVTTPTFDRGAAAKQGPTVTTPTFDRGAAAKQGPTVEAPTFDRGAAVHNAGNVAPGMAAEVKGGDLATGEAPAADEEATRPDGSTFRGR